MPRRDEEVGCIIPDSGDWPVDPQDDVEIDDNRLWIDGCFDFFHHGHAGVMLNARKLVGRTPTTGELWVGIHSDEDIRKNKGPTVMNLDERVAAVDACRWSTKSVPHSPYVTSLPWIGHYGCRFVVHGDDITSDASGNDCYRFVKKAGRMKIVPRTPGISTTDLVGRMLLCTKEHFIKSLADKLEGQEGAGTDKERAATGEAMLDRIREYASAPNAVDPYVSVYSFAPKHRSIERRRSSVRANGEPRTPFDHDPGRGTFSALISGNNPRPGQRVIYVDGGFDLFSSGHIAFLQTVTELEHELGKERDWYAADAKQQRIRDFGVDYGPAYVIAGVHDDEVVNFYKGINYPIMNIFERGLCVVQCAYVHSVVLSAPFHPSQTYLKSLPGLISPGFPDAVYHGPTNFMPSHFDPYTDAKALDIFRETPEHRFMDVNATQIVERILDNRTQYEERQRKKGVKGVGEAAKRREELEHEAEAQAAAEREAEVQRRRKEIERQFGA